MSAKLVGEDGAGCMDTLLPLMPFRPGIDHMHPNSLFLSPCSVHLVVHFSGTSTGPIMC